MRRRTGLCVLLVLALGVTKTVPAAAPGRPRFTDITRTWGVGLVTVNGGMPKHLILQSTGSGLAFLDYDRDGFIDLFVANGSTMAAVRSGEGGAGARLYHNVGGHGFEDCTAVAGVAETGWASGVAAADIDNDGFPDLYVTAYGRNYLYRNNGDGTFHEEAAEDRATVGGNSSGAAFGDVDGDGRLDLYVARYVDVDLAQPGPYPCTWKGIPVFCGPLGLKPASDVLLRARGDGTFRDVSRAAGLGARPPSYGFTPMFADVDGDGDQDIFVANDTAANFLWRNDGHGRFDEVGLLAGVAYSGDGRAQASMGADAADLNQDGIPDFVVTNFSHDTNTLYLSAGPEAYRDATAEAGLAESSLLMLGWAANFFDADNDGDLDLLVVNGHVYPEVDQARLGTSYAMRPQLYLNEGNARFREIGRSTGDLDRLLAGRSAALGDLDNDGDLDLAITQNDGPVLLLRNDTQGGSWVRFRLEGRESNRDAIGAVVTVTSSGRTFTRVERLQSGYFASHDPRLLFGLGAAERIDEVLVRWPRGAVERWKGLAVRREHLLLEGAAPPP